MQIYVVLRGFLGIYAEVRFVFFFFFLRSCIWHFSSKFFKKDQKTVVEVKNTSMNCPGISPKWMMSFKKKGIQNQVHIQTRLGRTSFQIEGIFKCLFPRVYRRTSTRFASGQSDQARSLSVCGPDSGLTSKIVG